MEKAREGYLTDYISGQELKATPEETQAVQPFAKKLYEDYGYPISHRCKNSAAHCSVR